MIEIHKVKGFLQTKKIRDMNILAKETAGDDSSHIAETYVNKFLIPTCIVVLRITGLLPYADMLKYCRGWKAAQRPSRSFNCNQIVVWITIPRL